MSKQFICLDCELTGLDYKNDRIIEVACVTFDLDQSYETFETLIDPEVEIPASSTEIHHITMEMVKGQPLIQTVLPKILSLVGDKIIMGHGIDLDIKFIMESCYRAGIPTTIQHNRTIDTLRMARLYGESPVNSLESLRKHFNIGAEIAHRAMSDVTVNIDVFKMLMKYYRSVDDLFKALSRPILLKEMPLGKHKGRPFKDIPLQYLLWAANKEFDQDLTFSLRSEIKKRKQGNLFTQATNPFHNL